MTTLKQNQTNFTAGYISKHVFGRSDLRSYQNGAQELRNVIIDPIGGIQRRSGTRFLSEINDAKRLIEFSFNTQQNYLFVLCHKRIDIYKNQEFLSSLSVPWDGNDIEQIAWTQSADTLLMVHPNYPPKMILRQKDESFLLTDWVYDISKEGIIYQPYHKFTTNNSTITLSGTSGEITITSSHDLFVNEHVGLIFKVDDGYVKIKSVSSSKEAKGSILKAPTKGHQNVMNYGEPAFSTIRGYPVTVTFFQGRLVIGGSRDLPNNLWLSKTFSIMNFDIGTGLDDEAIDFSILSDQVNAIRCVVPGRHLQVFTSGGEWMVSGDPLTPKEIQLKRQTKIGSPTNRYIPPMDVSGATLFVSSNGKEIREFLFEDLEQAYQAKNISILADDLINYPIDMAYDGRKRIVYVVMENGQMATLTNYRTEEVLAWSIQETLGKFLSVCIIGDDTYVLVLRGDKTYLEVFDDRVYTDCSLIGESEEKTKVWSDMTPLIGYRVKVITDGYENVMMDIEESHILLNRLCSSLIVGLPYAHQIIPLPPYIENSNGTMPMRSVRLVNIKLRVIDTQSVVIDVGSGFQQIILPKLSAKYYMDTLPQHRNQDVCVYALGWNKDGLSPLWEIKSDDPRAFKLVSVQVQLKVSE